VIIHVFTISFRLREDNKENTFMKAKTFFKLFLSCLVLFTLIFIPVVKGVSNINIFQTSDEFEGKLEDQMDIGVLVSSDSKFFNAFTESNRINVLMVGVNQDLTDTIMLVSWDMDENSVDVISVPRDTYYERDGYKSAAQKKINAAYGSEGIIGTANAVSDVLCGIPINYYAVVDYDSVRNIVDGIGGVPVDVPKAMKYDDPTDKPPLHINIPAGYQVLDGDHAVQYLRYRKGYAEGDLGRVNAQQIFVKSAFKQAVNNGLIDSAKLICKNVESDLTIGAATKFAVKAAGLSEDSIETYTVPGDGKYIGDVSYFIQDEEGTEEMLLEVYGMTSSDDNAEDDENE
jgi:LCP family protein required for cell wall assembly